jgi:ABC-2 type transport system permease protein
MGGAAENAKYATFFTLFNPVEILAREGNAIAEILLLLAGALALFAASVAVFRAKDLHI